MSAPLYQTSFHPTDRNISPDECMETTYDASIIDAAHNVAQDAIAYADTHRKARETPEWSAYMRVAAALIGDILVGSIGTTYPVEVTTGDNPRTIGEYRITTT